MNKSPVRPVCVDCGAKKGTYHILGCDQEDCSYCGLQLISCGHESMPMDDRMVYCGKRVGEKAAEEHGFYAKLIPGQGWVPCDKDDPQACLDINRVYAEMQWERHSGKFVLKG